MPKRPSYHRPNPRPLPRTEDKRERDKFYSGATWRKTRAAFLWDHPICADCEAKGILTEAKIAHHDKERLERPDLAYDAGNLVPLCSPCHTARHKTTASE